MISNRWLDGRKPHWMRLETLLVQAKRGLNRLSGSELQELGMLYRQTASDLSTVVDEPSGAQLAAYLNQLLGRSHNLLYLGRRSRPLDILTFSGIAIRASSVACYRWSRSLRYSSWSQACAAGRSLSATQLSRTVFWVLK